MEGTAFGQTWSTFADPDAEPDGIDFEGLNAIALFRQTQERYTRPLTEHIDVAAALENPAPDLTNAKGVSQVPDFVLRLRWRPEAGSTGLLGLSTFQRGSCQPRVSRPPAPRRAPQPAQHHARHQRIRRRPQRTSRLPLAAREGPGPVLVLRRDGIGRYITDLGTLGGQDAVYDSATDTMTALPVFAWYFGYETRWTSKWRSTFTYGTVIVNNLEIQPDNAFKQTNRGTLNITLSPIRRLDLVAEFLFGNRTNKDGSSGASSQIQLGSNFRF